MGVIAARSSLDTEADCNLTTLVATFKGAGYQFRHIEECKIEFMKWQALRPASIQWSVNGSAYIERGVRLVCFARTASELIDRLASLDA
jgi:hypothetical protein